MDEAAMYAESIASRVRDYRAGEIAPIDSKHVLRWVSQFGQPRQTEILREVDHVLGNTYWSRTRTVAYLRSTVANDALTGGNHRSYWTSVTLLQEQQRGSSQRILLELFREALSAECAIDLEDCRGESTYVYLDDGLFSGGHIVADIGGWIKTEAPRTTFIVVVTLVSHSSGRWWAEKRLQEIAAECGKRIVIRFHEGTLFRNAKTSSQNASVLWPDTLPESGPVADFVATLPTGAFQLRQLDGNSQPAIFSTEQARQLLEQEMLSAGVAIRARYDSLPDHWRPLGNSGWGLGFGSMVVTFINCPNNCPLALWWGDVERWPPSHWYPLFQRRTNERPVDFSDDIDDIPF